MDHSNSRPIYHDQGQLQDKPVQDYSAPSAPMFPRAVPYEGGFGPPPGSTTPTPAVQIPTPAIPQGGGIAYSQTRGCQPVGKTASSVPVQGWQPIGKAEEKG